jgi:glutaredoxin
VYSSSAVVYPAGPTIIDMPKKIRPAKVVIYTTLHCPHCQHTKRWFKKHKIPFLDFNVGKPGKIQKQFFLLGGRSVPLIVIGEHVIQGFDPQRLKQLLSKSGLWPSNP